MSLARAALVLCAATLGSGCAPTKDHGVVLWHAYTGAERTALEASAATWNAEHPTEPLLLTFVPYDAFADKLTSAIPNGNGPDLFIYGNDRIGDWASGGVIEDIGFWIDEATAAHYNDEALAAMASGDKLYGLPLTMKSLVLYYRPELVPTPPRTTNELLAMTPQFAARNIYPLAYANADLYGHAPWLHGFGGHIINAQGLPTLDDDGGVRAAEFARTLVNTGTVPADATGSQVTSMFADGRAAMAISGPWLIGELPAGLNFRVATLPIVSETGQPAAPLLGIEGVLMSARATDRQAAMAAMLFLAGDSAACERAVLARQVVPNRATCANASATDPVLTGFREQAKHAVPMPSAPAIRLVWTPYKTALGDILAGRANARTRLAATQAEVLRYLHGKSP